MPLVNKTTATGGGSQTLAEVLAAGNNAGDRDISGVVNLAADFLAANDEDYMSLPNDVLAGTVYGSNPDTSYAAAHVLIGGESVPGSGGGSVSVDAADAATGITGGSARIQAGGGGGSGSAAYVIAGGGNANGVTLGKVSARSNGLTGASGQALVSDGADQLVYGGVRVAAGVPVTAPAGNLPFAYDTTAVTGGFYFWNTAAWVKIATII